MNNKALNWFKFILALFGVVLLIAGIIFASGRYINKVDTIEKNVNEQIEKTALHDKAIYGMQKDIEHIRGAVDRIERKIDEQR